METTLPATRDTRLHRSHAVAALHGLYHRRVGISAWADELNPGFFERIRPYQELIEEILGHTDLRQDPVPYWPAADSKAMAEVSLESQLAHDGSERPVMAAYSKATLLMVMAEDHLDSLCRLFSEPGNASMYTPPVVLRALLETLGRAHWLVDTRIEAKRRVARSATETLNQGYWRRLTMTGDARREYDKTFAREKLLGWGRSMGLTVEKSGEGWFIGEPRPGSKKAIDRVFSGAAREDTPGNIFRHTSAVAHASFDGIFLNMQISASGNMAEPTVGTFILSDAEVRRIYAIAVFAYVFVASERRSLLGWSDPAWEATKERSSRLVLEALQ